jgi:hypothetical protein
MSSLGGALGAVTLKLTIQDKENLPLICRNLHLDFLLARSVATDHLPLVKSQEQSKKVKHLSAY